MWCLPKDTMLDLHDAPEERGLDGLLHAVEQLCED